MPRTEAQKEWQRKQRKAGKLGSVHVHLKTETVDEWKAFASFKCKPLATLIRDLVNDEMKRDNWKYNPPTEKSE